MNVIRTVSQENVFSCLILNILMDPTFHLYMQNRFQLYTILKFKQFDPSPNLSSNKTIWKITKTSIRQQNKK